MTDDVTKLSQLLREVVDDHPVLVPDLVAPARAMLRRRRIVTGGAAMAAVLAAAVAMSQLFPGVSEQSLVAGTPTVAQPTMTTASAVTTSAPTILTAEVVAARCAPQMVKYDALPQFSRMTNTWRVAHRAHSYRVGDIAAMLPANESSYLAYCRVPAAGHESDEVSFTSLEPSNLATVDRVAMCSESMSEQNFVAYTPGSMPSYDFNTADLRGATIVVTESADKMMMLVVEQGSALYVCTLYPQEWDFGGVGMRPLSATAQLLVGMNGSAAGAEGKSLVPGPATYYYGSGRLPSNARTIEFSVRGKLVHQVTATADGWWVAAFKIDGRNSLTDPGTWTIKDAAGKVLKTGSLNG